MQFQYQQYTTNSMLVLCAPGEAVADIYYHEVSCWLSLLLVLASWGFMHTTQEAPLVS